MHRGLAPCCHGILVSKNSCCTVPGVRVDTLFVSNMTSHLHMLKYESRSGLFWKGAFSVPNSCCYIFSRAAWSALCSPFSPWPQLIGPASTSRECGVLGETTDDILRYKQLESQTWRSILACRSTFFRVSRWQGILHQLLRGTLDSNRLHLQLLLEGVASCPGIADNRGV